MSGADSALLHVVAALAFQAAIRSRASGLRFGFAVGVVRGALALATSAMVYFGQAAGAVRATWAVGCALSIAVGAVMYGRFLRDSAGDDWLTECIEKRQRAPWFVLAPLDVIFLASSKTERGILVLVALAATAAIVIGLSVRTRRLAVKHVKRGALGLSSFANWLCALHAAILVSPILGVALERPEVLVPAGFVLLLALPLTAPIGSLLLVGVSYPPREFRPPVAAEPTPVFGDEQHPYRAKSTRAKLSRMPHWAWTAVSAVAASASLIWCFAAHWQLCAGGLEQVAPPTSWKSLPMLARGDESGLGPFKIHARHLSYKGYPAPYEHAKLGDPRLCFQGTVSLESWFTGDTALYRGLYELALRHDAKTGSYIVSGIDSHLNRAETDELIVAFQRRLSSRLAGDHPVSTWLSLGALTTFALGLVSALISRRQKRARFRKLSSLLFAICVVLSASLALFWTDDKIPRPGRELVRGNPWLI